VLETLIVFVVLLLILEAVFRFRRLNRIVNSADALNELGRKRLP
jgi:hypothetical protein